MEVIVKLAFDNDKYIKEQSAKIVERISHFDKLYLEFGGKLFDDAHASRVLPGFLPDSKLRMLLNIKDKTINIDYSNGTFNLLEMTINGLEYYVYFKAVASSASGVELTFE